MGPKVTLCQRHGTASSASQKEVVVVEGLKLRPVRDSKAGFRRLPFLAKVDGVLPPAEPVGRCLQVVLCLPLDIACGT